MTDSISLPRTFNDYRTLAHRLADVTEPCILSHFRANVEVENKAENGYDPVTRADREAERAMRTLIAETFPDHGIIGEEYDSVRGDSDYTWILDPVDGTRAFIMGLPVWGTLIALCYRGKPVLGLVNQPWTGERFEGDANGARMTCAGHETLLQTRACPTLENAMLASTSPEVFKVRAEQDAFKALTARVRMHRFGGDCYSYCLLAMGLIDLVVESSLKLVDVQALVPIVEGAGGVITDWRGRPEPGGGQIIAAGDKTLHAAALNLLAPAAV